MVWSGLPYNIYYNNITFVYLQIYTLKILPEFNQLRMFQTRRKAYIRCYKNPVQAGKTYSTNNKVARQNENTSIFILNFYSIIYFIQHRNKIEGIISLLFKFNCHVNYHPRVVRC